MLDRFAATDGTHRSSVVETLVSGFLNGNNGAPTCSWQEDQANPNEGPFCKRGNGGPAGFSRYAQGAVCIDDDLCAARLVQLRDAASAAGCCERTLKARQKQGISILAISLAACEI